MNPQNSRPLAKIRCLCVSVALLLGCALLFSRTGWTADSEPGAAKKQNQFTAAFLTLESTINDSVTASVRRTALELQETALKEKREAVLVLELTPGISEFHHVFALSEFLVSDATANLKTICWVPQSVSGTNVCIALACQEIVLHPDATLGDIGRGQALDANAQTIVKSLIAKRRNRRVTEALAVGLMDPTQEIVQITFEPVPGAVEKRLATQAEAQQLRNNGTAIRDSVRIKEAGASWMITANQASEWGVLSARTATTRKELVDAYGLPVESMRERPILKADQKVELIEIHGAIDPMLKSFLHRQIERAIAGGAKIIIFDVDSPGGLTTESMELAYEISAIKDRGVHAVAFIPRKAYSGAAFISLAADDIYMLPEADIGNAGTIAAIGPGGQFEAIPEKVLGPIWETLRELSRRKGRPEGVLLAMGQKDKKVFQVTHKTNGSLTYMTDEEIHEKGDEWIRGPMVRESGQGYLTLSGRRAHELQVAQPPVKNFEELKEQLGIPANQRLTVMKRTWVDDLVFKLNRPHMMGMLFFLAMVACYLEAKTLTGVFGLVSVICFGLFFWSKVLGGTAGTLEVVLFMLGVGCLLLEFLVLPGFGVFGITGVFLVLASIVMASQTFGHLGPQMSDFDQSLSTLKIFGGATAGMIVTAVALARYLPSIPLFKDMILSPPGESDMVTPRLRPELMSGAGSLVGLSGVAMTLLRPSGKAQIDGRYVDVISEGEFIPEGTPIQVVESNGKRVVVRKV